MQSTEETPGIEADCSEREVKYEAVAGLEEDARNSGAPGRGLNNNSDTSTDKEQEKGVPQSSSPRPQLQPTRQKRNSIEHLQEYPAQHDRLVLEKYAMYKTESVRDIRMTAHPMHI